MDSENRMILIIEDDMGEGFVDPIEEDPRDSITRKELKEAYLKAERNLQSLLKSKFGGKKNA